MDKIKRREFLKLIGAGGVGTGAGMLFGESTKMSVELLVPQVVPPEDYTPGIATFYNTVCRQCSAGCGISVRTREGRAKKIEGNPVHPVNQGRLCAMGQAGLNGLYNPDRIRQPLKRTGERGSGQYTEISWDEAIAELGGRLGSLKSSDGGDQVHLLCGAGNGHINDLFAQFMQGLGSDNYLHYDFTHPINLHTANKLSFDEDLLPYYDIKNTDYLLSFGADYLGSWLSPVHHSLSYGHMRQGRGERRGKCVQIESRMSLSGASADEWIVANPGTEGLIALAMAHAIVRGDTYQGDDRAEWIAATESYAASVVAEQTGVAESDIVRLAEEFVASRPSLAIGGGVLDSSSNAVSSLIAINALNYLAGNLNVEGGVLFNPAPTFSNGSRQRFASYSRMLQLAQSMNNGEVDVLMVHDSNPLFTLPAAANFRDAINKVSMIASFSSFMDETTAMADLILPTDTALESWGDVVPEMGVGLPVASIAQPVVTPIFDTRSVGDIVLQLAHQIGAELPVAMPWTVFEDYLKDTWKEIYQDSAFAGVATDFEGFWSAALQSGVWGEVQPRAARIKEGLARSLLDNLDVAAPSFSGDATEFDFTLQPYLTQKLGDGRGANSPWLQELPDPMTSIVYQSWVELNPKTAADLGIRDGDVLAVTSTEGTIRLPAFVFPAIKPDVVAVPIGQGHTHYGRYAKDHGVNPLQIVAPEVDELSGALAWAATRVRIAKTGERIELVRTDGVPRTLGRQILSDSSEHG
jgi:anaerobic selenocysteine-containing dehydrogenase|tara:strand:+ start:14245 stop:16494 length:2250 start_codon:yes stop_codon:yes gene_type:complete